MEAIGKEPSPIKKKTEGKLSVEVSFRSKGRGKYLKVERRGENE